MATEESFQFKGTVIVPIDALDFPYEGPRGYDGRNVERLKKLISKDCDRLSIKNHIPAEIDHQQLNKILTDSGISTTHLNNFGSLEYPRIDLPIGFRLKCLHGRHRILAAAAVLAPCDRHWTVDLYTNLSENIRRTLIEEYASEKKPDDGEIYCKIREYQGHLGAPTNPILLKRWWARVEAIGGIRARNLKQILAHPEFTSAFDVQLRVPGLSAGMRLTATQKLFAMRCPELILHYLKVVQDWWSGIFGGDKTAMQKVDRPTVKALELTAPGLCHIDRENLYCKLEKGEIFAAFNKEDRETIWRKVLLASTDRLIPSLHSFFNDVYYLQGPIECMKMLINFKPIDKTDTLPSALNQAFKDRNQEDRQCVIQISEKKFVSKPGNSSECLELGSRQLWLKAFRDWIEMSAPLGTGKNLTARPSNKWIPSTVSSFVSLAYILGFRAEKEHCQTTQEPTESVSMEMDKISRSERAPKRSGIPRLKEYQEDKLSLFLFQLSDDTFSPREVTSFFIRRSVYFSFFGKSTLTITDIKEISSMDDNIQNSSGDGNTQDHLEVDIRSDVEMRDVEETAIGELGEINTGILVQFSQWKENAKLEWESDARTKLQKCKAEIEEKLVHDFHQWKKEAESEWISKHREDKEKLQAKVQEDTIRDLMARQKTREMDLNREWECYMQRKRDEWESEARLKTEQQMIIWREGAHKIWLAEQRRREEDMQSNWDKHLSLEKDKWKKKAKLEMEERLKIWETEKLTLWQQEQVKREKNLRSQLEAELKTRGKKEKSEAAHQMREAFPMLKADAKNSWKAEQKEKGDRMHSPFEIQTEKWQTKKNNVFYDLQKGERKWSADMGNIERMKKEQTIFATSNGQSQEDLKENSQQIMSDWEHTVGDERDFLDVQAQIQDQIQKGEELFEDASSFHESSLSVEEAEAAGRENRRGTQINLSMLKSTSSGENSENLEIATQEEVATKSKNIATYFGESTNTSNMDSEPSTNKSLIKFYNTLEANKSNLAHVISVDPTNKEELKSFKRIAIKYKRKGFELFHSEGRIFTNVETIFEDVTQDGKNSIHLVHRRHEIADSERKLKLLRS